MPLRRGQSWKTAAPWVLAVGVLAFIAALAGIDARATYGARVTSDEPQYLLTALSLGEDLDLDISDELAAEAYLPFHEIGLNPQTIELNESGQRLSPHDPLLPLVLAMPMVVGGWGAAKTTMALIAALGAMATMLVALRIGVSVPIAALVVGAFFASAPLGVYGTQIYPAMLAGLLTTLGVLGLTAPGRRRLWSVVVVATIVALPWLAVKYALNAAVLAGFLLWRARAESPRAAAFWTLVLAVCGTIYLVVHQRVFGGWTVYAAGDHFVNGEFEVIGTDPAYLARTNRLIGLLVDRSYGLAAWSPAYLFFPAAVAAAIRRRIPHIGLFMATIVAAWVVATWVALTMHGWWFPGRQVVHVLPLIAVLVAALVDEYRRLVWPFVVAGAVGIASWMWLAVEASTDRRTLVVDFDETSNPWYRAWSELLPDHRLDGPWDQTLTIIWLAILAATALATWRARPNTGKTVSGPPPDFP